MSLNLLSNRRWHLTAHSGILSAPRPSCVYAVKADLRALFWRFVDDLANTLDVAVSACWVPHHRDKRNVAAVLSVGIELNQSFLTGVQIGR